MIDVFTIRETGIDIIPCQVVEKCQALIRFHSPCFVFSLSSVLAVLFQHLSQGGQGFQGLVLPYDRPDEGSQICEFFPKRGRIIHPCNDGRYRRKWHILSNGAYCGSVRQEGFGRMVGDRFQQGRPGGKSFRGVGMGSSVAALFRFHRRLERSLQSQLSVFFRNPFGRLCRRLDAGRGKHQLLLPGRDRGKLSYCITRRMGRKCWYADIRFRLIGG